ncbi:MAG TPA: hypothetical protein VFO69_02465 [Allosphingosinicella sp.]|nr:hypothetical protein [Allosphingosinicella sp.]
MGFELERILYDTEDFLLRTMRSGTVRQAQRKRAQRKWQEAMRRMRRATWILAGLLIMLVGAGIVTDIGFFTWLVALPTAFFVAFLSLFWPSRQKAEAPQRMESAPLEEMAIRAADGLLDRCDELPGRAIGSADLIIGRLHELAPHLGALRSGDPAEGDARRLICQHLPRLVDTYLDLPPSMRAPGSEATTRFTESLTIVAQEFDSLLDRCCRDRQLGFETQHRFIETRYRDGSLGSD